jgi:hypothetical protein
MNHVLPCRYMVSNNFGMVCDMLAERAGLQGSRAPGAMMFRCVGPSFSKCCSTGTVSSWKRFRKKEPATVDP